MIPLLINQSNIFRDFFLAIVEMSSGFQSSCYWTDWNWANTENIRIGLVFSVLAQWKFLYCIDRFDHIKANKSKLINNTLYWHDNYQWQYKKYSVKKWNFSYVNLQIGESLVTAVEIWIFRKTIKTPGMEQKMFIKSKLLAWSAKSRKTPGMECKVQINSWHGVQSSFK
jgi:hypothetical protein